MLASSSPTPSIMYVSQLGCEPFQADLLSQIMGGFPGLRFTGIRNYEFSRLLLAAMSDEERGHVIQ